MNKLITQSGGHRGCLGLSLRGNCATAADATLLRQAVSQLLTTWASRIWVDCRHLYTLSELGQHSLLCADRSARAVGTTLYWCGLPEHLLDDLYTSSLQPAIELLPAEAYQGPVFRRAGAVSSAV